VAGLKESFAQIGYAILHRSDVTVAVGTALTGSPYRDHSITGRGISSRRTSCQTLRKSAFFARNQLLNLLSHFLLVRDHANGSLSGGAGPPFGVEMPPYGMVRGDASFARREFRDRKYINPDGNLAYLGAFLSRLILTLTFGHSVMFVPMISEDSSPLAPRKAPIPPITAIGPVSG
jgi:hypothetical protein